MTNGRISRPAWAEINLNAVAHNLNELRRVTGSGAKVMAVVKANAYGHGAVEVSKTALDNGADYLGVALLNEAQELRAAGIKAPILILGYTHPEQVPDAVMEDITLTVYNIEGAKAISDAAVALGKKGKIHVKVDTGMGRLGFLTDIDAAGEIMKIAALPGVELEGMFTHFAVSDIKDKEYSKKQFEKFTEIDFQLKKMGLHIPIKHSANSAAIIDLPDFHADMVRAGVSLYGLYPSEEVFKDKVNLIPAMTFKARIANVKAVPAGISISYGRTYTTKTDTKVATIPVGYADGYTRLFSNRSHILVKGVRVPVIGRVCMDQFMVDVSNIPDVSIGDEVVLMGRQGDQAVTADELAEMIGTINYEIVCMVSARVPRVYIGSTRTIEIEQKKKNKVPY